MDRPTVRARILESLTDPTNGSFKLERAINLVHAHSPTDKKIPERVDFGGVHGAAAFALALAGGNWRAAAIIVAGGYQPEEPSAAVRYLLDHPGDAVDFFGGPAQKRLSIICGGHSSCDDRDLGLLKFILAVAGPWEERALTPCLYLTFLHGRGAALQQLLVAAGADTRRSLVDVRAQLLTDVGLAGLIIGDVAPIEVAAVQTDLKSVGMDDALIALLSTESSRIEEGRKV